MQGKAGGYYSKRLFARDKGVKYAKEGSGGAAVTLLSTRSNVTQAGVTQKRRMYACNTLQCGP